MFDLRGHDVTTSSGFGQAQDGEVIRFSRSGGENHLAPPGGNHGGDLIAGVLYCLPRACSILVGPAALIAELDLQIENGKVKAYRAKVKVSFKFEGD